MHQTTLILIAAGVSFLLVWGLVAWLKFREHHHIIHHEPREKTHISNFFKWRRNPRRP